MFDPVTVREGSDYKAGEQGLPPVGLPHMIVNGVFVKRDSKATDQFPGQPIRYPVEDKPRHLPASQKQWIINFTIDDGSLSPRKKLRTPRNDEKQSSSQKTKPVATKLDKSLACRSTEHARRWWGDRPYHALPHSCQLHAHPEGVLRHEGQAMRASKTNWSRFQWTDYLLRTE